MDVGAWELIVDELKNDKMILEDYLRELDEVPEDDRDSAWESERTQITRDIKQIEKELT